MIATRDLRELATFVAQEGPVLSVYFDADPARQLKDQARLVLRELLERARVEGAREQDLERVARFVDFEYDWQGRGLTLFSCQADGLWVVYPLPVPVRNQAFVGDTIHLAPLAGLLDRYAPYVVVAVDQEGARMLLIDMGGVAREEDSTGEPIKHQKQGGWSAQRYQRHEDRLADYNLRVAAEAVTRFCEASGCTRLVLGGTEENTTRFQGLLPQPMQKAVVGAVRVDRNVPAPEIIERSFGLLQQAAGQYERELVEQMITFRAKGGVAVTGLADTLLALQEGRVLTLLVADGFSAPGYLCPGCDYLSADQGERCLFCSDTEARPLPDVVERAVHKAIAQDARVYVIAGNPALAKAGNIGAFLRY